MRTALNAHRRAAPGDQARRALQSSELRRRRRRPWLLPAPPQGRPAHRRAPCRTCGTPIRRIITRRPRHPASAPRAVGIVLRARATNDLNTPPPCACAHGGAHHARLLGRTFSDFNRAALAQRTHLHHLLQVVLKHQHIDETRTLKPSQKKLPGPSQMDGARRHRCRSALCHGFLNSRHRASPAFAASNLHLRLHIRKPQPHRAVPHDALHVPAPAAAAVVLLVVQRHHRVGPPPPTRLLGRRMAPIADPHARRPTPDHAVQLAQRLARPGPRQPASASLMIVTTACRCRRPA